MVKKNSTKILYLSLLSFVGTVGEHIAVARTQTLTPITPGIATLPDLIHALLDIVVKVGVPIAAIFIIYSGFLFVTAQGDTSKITKAYTTFMWTIIGTAVLLGSWFLATAIQGTIQQIAG